MEIRWADATARHVATRSARYPGALDIEIAWTEEVMNDEHLVAIEPDPKSRVGAGRYIGWSTSAERVLVILAYRDLTARWHGINAWPASRRDIAIYQRKGN